jgi:phage-related protein
MGGLDNLDLLIKGTAFDIYIFDPEKKGKFRKFIEKLPKTDYNKVNKLLKDTTERGLLKNTEKFKKLETGIYEFKSYQIRIFCFLDNGRIIILTNGFIKKSQKTPSKEIKIARDLMNNYFQSKKGEKNEY